MLFVRFACTMLVAVAISVESVLGQRVYANEEQHNATIIIASVTSPGNATGTNSFTDFSTLSVLIGALGALGVAEQNLQFTGTKPTKYSPVIVQFTAINTSLSVLNLLGGVSMQTTNSNVGVGPTYTGQALLDLVGLFSSGTVKEVKFNGPGVTYDGIKMNLATVLGLGISARYYYAFFITPPTINGITVCSGLTASLSVTNPQTGYQYKWYDLETGGTLLATTTTGSFVTSTLSATRSFYVEAIESGTTAYNSARTKVDVTVLPKPSTPAVSMNH